MSDTAEILKAARALISEPEHWTQETYARDKDGNKAHVQSPSAYCFCSSGAVRRACIEQGEENDEVAGEAVLYLSDMVDGMSDSFNNIVIYNDNHTHAEVLAVFDKAIASLSPEVTA
jgi:hypothetical protein